MENFFIGIVILVFGAFLSLFVKNQSIKLKLVTLGALVGSIFALFSALSALFVGNYEYTLHFGTIFPNVRFVLDNLSAFFVVVISVMSTLGVIYSNGYLKPYIEKGKDLSAHCIFLPMLLASMLLVVTVQNALTFLIVWELMSLSSFFLVIFEHEKAEVIKSGIKYLVYMHVSVVFIIAAFVLLTINTSSFDFAHFKAVLANDNYIADIVFILAFIGFGIKAGFTPFHNWLPDAHPAAPSHVSGIMSGVMIKTGIYGILRTLDIIGTPSAKLGFFVLIISTISALYGVLYAICQHDLKRLLAYHSIENIGIIGMGIGVGMIGLTYNCTPVAVLGFTGGILHVLNHSIFKELLFLAAGSVYVKTHTRDIEILGGLLKSMPKTGALFLLGSIAICGLPPFNGFISEFLIYFGMLKGLTINHFIVFIAMILALAGLALVGTMAILCFTKAFSIIFLGEARSENASKVKEDNSSVFILPMAILGLFITFVGIFPEVVFDVLTKPASIFVEIGDYSNITNLMQIISFVSLGLLIAIVFLHILKSKIYKNVENHVTWGCGYNRANPYMQYSASSYASPFISTLTPLFKRVADIKKPKAVFEGEAHYSLHMEDVEEAYFLQPVISAIEKFLTGFEKIQNGNIQSYIMYGLIFLVLALAGVVALG